MGRYGFKSHNIYTTAVVHFKTFCLLITSSEILFLVSRGEKQECKFFDQLVQIFGSKYVINSDPLADDTADGVGKKAHCLTFVHHVSIMQWL